MKKNNFISNFQESNKYRSVIHDLIPGGAHTYSKGDDQFPINSPAAITHGIGAYVWDLDGNKYLDTLMGLTSVSLGHAYEPVLERVREELLKGSNFSRPSVIEREMAERFLSLVPQHDMIKYAKKVNSLAAQFCVMTPFPGTKLYEDLKDRIITTNWADFTEYNPTLRLDNLSSSEVIKYRDLAYKKYYMRPAWLTKYIWRIIS